jgi:hypothetical protein
MQIILVSAFLSSFYHFIGLIHCFTIDLYSLLNENYKRRGVRSFILTNQGNKKHSNFLDTAL